MSSKIDSFIVAAANNMFEKMQLLLDEGIDINGKSSITEATALSVAAEYCSIRSVNFLLEKGADIDIPGESDMTPLMYACSRGKVKGSKIALRLIMGGANVSYVRQADDMTALKFAVEDCHPEVITALVKAGADVNGPSETDITPLMLAARANNIDTIKALIENGADPLLKCKLSWAENRTAQELAELEKRKKAATYLASLS